MLSRFVIIVVLARFKFGDCIDQIRYLTARNRRRFLTTSLLHIIAAYRYFSSFYLIFLHGLRLGNVGGIPIRVLDCSIGLNVAICIVLLWVVLWANVMIFIVGEPAW